MKVETKICRHGRFSYFVDDEFVGHSLRFYGEYGPDEVALFEKVLKLNDVVVEVGSNIGALTIPLARLCKQVYAFEPHPENFELLHQNVRQNDLFNVTALNMALGSRSGFTRMFSLDRLGHFNFGRLEIGDGNIQVNVSKLDEVLDPDEPIRFIKIDVEGAELDVLKGAEQTIARWRPLLYVENDREHRSAELVGWLIDHDYKCHWHKAPLFYEGNFLGEKLNIFPNVVSENMICFPEEMKVAISKLPEVPDKRADDQLYIRAKARMLKRLSRVEPDSLDALNIRATIAHYCNLMNDEEAANAFLKENLAHNPEHLGSLAMFGLFELQRGNYKAWKSYELRYLQDNPASFGWRPHDAPHWDGKPTDKVVLVWSEQGWGDSIMFCRFMRDVLERAPNAILDIQPQFFELFESSKIMPPGQMFRRYRKQPKYDFHCSMPSLPAVLELETESALTRGKYLFPDEGLVESWKEHKNPKIGICHHGAAYSERPYSRDMPWELANNLAQRFGPFMTLTHEGQWESFADTAAAIETLDLVITVDTAIAHLAGALGVPTWLMLSTDPDWRWQKRRSDTPWYPSMRIFRQKKFMDWSGVVDEIAAELERQKAEAA